MHRGIRGGLSRALSVQTKAELTTMIHVEVVMAREVGVENELLHSIGFGIKENIHSHDEVIVEIVRFEDG